MNNLKKATLTLFLFGLIILVQSCKICYPNRWNRQYAEIMDYVECLTAKKLKDMIVSDTSHYKIVVFWSPCCGPCLRHLKETYAPAYIKNRDDVKFYFITENSGGIKYSRTTLNSFGINNDKVLCFIDDDPRFYYQDKNPNIQFFNNLANYIFTNGPKVSGLFGTPTEFIVSKDNRVLKSLVTTPTSGSAIVTTQLYEIDFDKIQEINFDSIYHLDLDFDLFEFDSVCNDDFCPIPATIE